MKTQPQDIIKELEQTSKRTEKEAILKRAHSEGLPKFFEGLRLALDPLIVFNIKKVPEKKDTTNTQGLSWELFLEFANKLRSKELTGNAAHEGMKLVMDLSTEDQWNYWYRRILIKDLRCGVSEKTVNKVVPNMIPVFGCQLAHDAANHESKVTGKKQVEVKLDGCRVITVIQDNKVEMFSRNGRQFHNFGHIVKEIEAVLEKSPALYDLVLDGEVMSASFQDLMRQVHRKTDVNNGDAILHLFDVCPLDDFLNGAWDKPQCERSKYVQAWVGQHADALAHVQALEWENVDLSTHAGYERFRELNKQAVEGGYEGIMLKNPDAAYTCKRTTDWLKIKPFIEVTLRIIDVQEGTGKNKGRLGAFVLEGEEDGKEIHVNCGSGFTDAQRDYFWEFGYTCIDSLAEVRADAITQNQDGTYSLRFPRFKTFRSIQLDSKI